MTTKSAAEDMDMIFMQVAHRFVTKAVNKAWKSYARQELGMGAFKMNLAGEQREAFFSSVTEALRSGSRDYPEQILEAMDAVREVHETLLRMAKEANLAGFQDVAENANYIHRMYRRDKFVEMSHRHGDEPGH